MRLRHAAVAAALAAGACGSHPARTAEPATPLVCWVEANAAMPGGHEVICGRPDQAVGPNVIVDHGRPVFYQPAYAADLQAQWDHPVCQEDDPCRRP